MLQQIIDQAPRFFGYYNVLFLLQAFAATFLLSLAGCVLGFALGFLLAVMRRTADWRLAPARGLMIVFTEAFRRIPFLVTLMLVFFAFQALKFDVSMFTVALFSVCLIATAFITEIVRAGLDSVHRNQWDAAAAMNFSGRGAARPPSISVVSMFSRVLRIVAGMGGLHRLFGMLVYHLTICQETLARRWDGA